ncbi:MAG: hypothetical protein RBR45_15095 [Pseudomonas sp.]|jgi:hypothetical protein|nr:hypothetical protein [Pseudomonas sp.]
MKVLAALFVVAALVSGVVSKATVDLVQAATLEREAAIAQLLDD